MFKEELLDSGVHVKCETPAQREAFIKWCEQNNPSLICNLEQRKAEGSMREVSMYIRAGGGTYAWYYSVSNPRESLPYNEALKTTVLLGKESK